VPRALTFLQDAIRKRVMKIQLTQRVRPKSRTVRKVEPVSSYGIPDGAGSGIVPDGLDDRNQARSVPEGLDDRSQAVHCLECCAKKIRPVDTA
jgi:hypothetical protein